MPPPSHVLVIRPDRLGDLVLTTPMVQALDRAGCPRVDLVVSPGLAGLASRIPGVDQVYPRPPTGAEFGALLDEVHPSHIVFPYAEFGLVARSFFARIPHRLGNRLRLYGPFLNQGVSIHRKSPPIHEADFCLRLLEPLGLGEPGSPLPRIPPPQEGLDQLDRLRQEAGLPEGPYWVFHPGGGGSAGRPTAEGFARIHQSLGRLREALPTWVSYGPGERELAQELAKRIDAQLLPEAPSLDQTHAILAEADLVVAGSTGPLHLAAASGTPTLGLYPRKASQIGERWGPRGERTSWVTPPLGDCLDCREGRCVAPACFDRIPDQAFARALADLGLAPAEETP